MTAQITRRAFATGAAALPALPFTALPFAAQAQTMLDVRRFGARGDGRGIDSVAINRAIAAAARGGGGIVHLPAGRYLCFSIRLRSNITLSLAPGAVIIAADVKTHGAHYDLPEPNAHEYYQHFITAHWHNSLIWAVGESNVAVVGPGLIEGGALTRGGPNPMFATGGLRPESMNDVASTPVSKVIAELELTREAMNGLANKAIGLSRCRNVVLRDFAIRDGGHMSILASGTSELLIDHVRVDTRRDGIDIDCCRNVRVVNTSVNSPNDDGIVLKSTLTFGEKLPTENVVIANCIVSGFDPGTMLDGTYGRTQMLAPDQDRPTGRIKFGTDSSGGFRNIAISNVIFDRCRGLAIETVDGGMVEEVTVNNLTMREVSTAPIFLRVGDRRRGPPATTGLGAMRRISISNVTAFDIDPRFAASVVGLPDSRIEDVTLSNLRFAYRGGGTRADAARTVPEKREAYPEPSMFGTLPAYGLYVRDARGIRVNGLDLSTAAPDARVPILLERVADVDLDGVRAARPAGTDLVTVRDGSGVRLPGR